MRRILIAVILLATTLGARAQDGAPRVAGSPSGYMAQRTSIKAAHVPRFDWKFDTLLAGEIASSLYDSAQTINCLNHFANCRETNSIYGPHPSAARLYGTSLALVGAYAFGSYELRRHGPAPLRRLWPCGMADAIYEHIDGIVTSAKH